MTVVLLAALVFACGPAGNEPLGVLPLDSASRQALSANCELPSEALAKATLSMLPGRRCLYCHGDGRSAASQEHFTAGGTVFTSTMPTTCDEGGPKDVVVDLLREDGSVQATTRTWTGGNFFLKQALTFPLRARLTRGTHVIEMPTPVDSGDCASCHGVSTGRIAAP